MDENEITRDLLLVSKTRGGHPPQVEGTLYSKVMGYIKQADPGHSWLVDFLKGQEWTLAELERDHERYAALLNQVGYRQGDILHSLLGPEDERIFPAVLGALRLGGVVAFGDALMGPESLRIQLLDEECKHVLTSPENFSTLTEALIEIPAEKKPKVLCLGSPTDSTSNLPFVDILSKLDKVDLNHAPKVVPIDDVKGTAAAITFTSGTTGVPKGIVHSHHSFLHYFNPEAGEIEGKTIMLGTRLGLFPTFLVAIGYLLKGNTVVKNFDRASNSAFVQNLLEAMRAHKPYMMLLNPGHFAELTSLIPLPQNETFPTVQAVHPAAFTPSPELIAKMRLVLPNASIQTHYGVAELGLFTFSPDVSTFLGKVRQDCSIKIVDPETGTRLPPGQSGELRAKSPFTMMGYLNRVRETKDYFDEEGYAKIGDLASYDSKGKITYMGRLKEVIRLPWRGGFTDIPPLEIEALVAQHDSIKDCIVYEATEEGTGKIVLGLGVVPVANKDGSQTKAENIRSFINGIVPKDSMKITGPVLFFKQLPRNRMDKLMRHKFMELLKESTD